MEQENTSPNDRRALTSANSGVGDAGEKRLDKLKMAFLLTRADMCVQFTQSTSPTRSPPHAFRMRSPGKLVRMFTALFFLSSLMFSLVSPHLPPLPATRRHSLLCLLLFVGLPPPLAPGKENTITPTPTLMRSQYGKITWLCLKPLEQALPRRLGICRSDEVGKESAILGLKLIVVKRYHDYAAE